MPEKRKHRRETSFVSNGNDSESDDRQQKKVRWKGSAAAQSVVRSRINDKTSEPNDSGGEDNDQEESTDSVEPTEETCMAAFCTHGRVGVAYYDPLKGIIHVLEDTQETVHFDLTRMLLEQIQPDIVLTSSKSEDGFVDVVRDFMDGAGGTFQIRPFKEFNAKRGHERLVSLTRLTELPLVDVNAEGSDSGGAQPTSHLQNAYELMRRRGHDVDPTAQRWNAAIRLANFASGVETSPFCVSSIGALIDLLVRQRAAGDFDDDGIDGLDVRDIRMLVVDEVMHINADALLSLQVFESESHASVHSDKTKEGLSLFGILNATKTTLGKQMLRTWLLRPSLSITTISARHDAVANFMRAENVVTANLMHNHLKGIKNMPRILKTLVSGRAQLSDWQGFVKFTFHTTMLRGELADLHGASDVSIVKKLLEAMDIASFKEIGNKVNEVVDWEESVTAERVCVRPRIDEELDNWKHAYHGIDSVLSSVAEKISQDVSSDIAPSLNVVYFPQLGYLICVPMRPEWCTGMPAVDGWTFQFSSEAHVYFKSQEMHDMDLHIGDLHSTIVDRELELIQALLEEVVQFVPQMEAACDVCAELDVLLSFAAASRLNNYVRPEIAQENVIDIVGGRHPLHEQILDTFVANDARVIGGSGIGVPPITTLEDGREWNSVILCTGANACGKSVYMKQTALIQIMAQIGCFVPAEAATLGITDKIFTRVSTRESVSKAQSAFMIDLNQVSLALRNCTARSLILLDEFGKGTLSTDGAGLFCGVLMHLLNRGQQCPKVLVATHFHEVFTQDLLDVADLPITFCHMQVMFTSDSATYSMNSDATTGNSQGGMYGSAQSTRAVEIRPRDKITYLYRVAQGLSADSHAAQCAAMFGIPDRIVSRAQHVSELISSHEVVQLLDEEMTDMEKADLEDAEEVCKRFLAWDLDEREGVDVKEKLKWVLGMDEDD